MPQLDGKQTKDGSIAEAKLAAVYTDTVVRRGGSVAFTADQSMGGNKLTNIAAPVGPNDAARKIDLEDAIEGRDTKQSVRLATTGPLPANFRSGNSLIGSANGYIGDIDGSVVVAGDRLLIKSEVVSANNGIFDVINAGSPAVVYTITRSIDANTSADVTSGMFTFCSQGSTNLNTGFTLITNDPITLNTTALDFTQSSGAGQVIGGAGIQKTGNTLDILAGVGITVGADSVGISPSGVSATELAASVAGAGLIGGAGTALAVGSGTGMNITADSVGIADGGVGSVQLSPAVAGAGLTGGAGAALAVGSGVGITVGADTVGISPSGVSATELAASVAGAGLTGGAGAALAVGAGTGMNITADSVGIADSGVTSTQLAASVAGAGLTGGAGTALAVVSANGGIVVGADNITFTASNDSLVVSGAGVKSAVPTSLDKNRTPLATASDNASSALTLSALPGGDSYVRVEVNGIPAVVGDGTKTSVDCYFSADAGVTAKTIAAFSNGDTLYWNGSIAGYQLATSDRVDMLYSVA